MSESLLLALIIVFNTLLYFYVYMIIFPATYGKGKYPYFMNPQLSYLDEHVGYGVPVVKMLLLQLILVGFIFGVFQSMTKDKAIKWYGHIAGIFSVGLLYVYYQYGS